MCISAPSIPDPPPPPPPPPMSPELTAQTAATPEKLKIAQRDAAQQGTSALRIDQINVPNG